MTKKDADTLHEWEIRLNSNVIFLKEYMDTHGNKVIEQDNGSGEKIDLMELIRDIDDVREEIDRNLSNLIENDKKRL